jgi:hypothetical protein
MFTVIVSVRSSGIVREPRFDELADDVQDRPVNLLRPRADGDGTFT